MCKFEMNNEPTDAVWNDAKGCKENAPKVEAIVSFKGHKDEGEELEGIVQGQRRTDLWQICQRIGDNSEVGCPYHDHDILAVISASSPPSKAAYGGARHARYAGHLGRFYQIVMENELHEVSK